MSSGGGIAISGIFGMTLSAGTVIADNSASFSGGGIYLEQGQSKVEAATFRNNRAGSGSGGGIENASPGNLELNGDVIEQNFAAGNGGGVSSIDVAGLSLSHCFVLDNGAGLSGGGVNENGGNAMIVDTTISGNSAQQNGGGTFVGFTGSIEVTDSEVVNNSAFIDGGGLYDTTEATLTLTGCTVANNVAFSLGGGIAFVGATTGFVNVYSSLIRDNTAVSKAGGIFADGGTVIVDFSELSANAASDGGAAWLAATFSFADDTVDSNRAAISAGAFDLEATTANNTMFNDTIANNASGDLDGAITLAGGNGSLVTLTNDTIDGNTAAMADSGGIGMATGGIAVKDTIIAHNTAVGAPSDFLYAGGVVADGGGNLLGSDNGTSGKLGPATIIADPKLGPLVDNGGLLAGAPSDGRVVPTQALLPGSPAIGKGVAGAGVPPTDERGFARPGTPSIGSYEPLYASNATPNQAYVENLYEVFQNRVADPGGLAGWTNYLNHGGAPSTLIQALEVSTKYLDREAILLVRRYLDRAASADEVANVASYLSSGHSPEQVASIFLNSGEFAQDYESPDAFIEGLYQTVFDRAAELDEVAGWKQAMSAGTSRAAMVNIFLSIPNYTADVIAADFLAYLGRLPTPSEASAYLHAAQLGYSDAALEALILGSGEAFAGRT
jgi:hypothetical protein